MNDYTPDRIIQRVSDSANADQPLPLDIRFLLVAELREAMRNRSHALVCSGCGKRTELTPHEAQIWQDGVEELDMRATCKVCEVGVIALVEE